MTKIVITGASQGIGRAIAKAFASEPDAELALVARNTARLQAVAQECYGRGAKNVLVQTCDITDNSAVVSAAQAILAKWGGVDVLVNNAGQFRPGTILETSSEMFDQQTRVNLTGAFGVTRAFLASMVRAQHGHIFYMASVASIKAYPSGVAYCAAKHGLLGLARAVREEMKVHGIRVTAVLPGATNTPSWDGANIDESRLMRAEDVAKVVVEVTKLSPVCVAEEIILRPQLGDV